MTPHPSYGYATESQITALKNAPYGGGKEILKAIGFKTRAVKASATKAAKKAAE